MNRFFTTFLMAGALGAFALNAETVDGIEYELDAAANTAAVTGCEATMTELVIPATITVGSESYSVTSIAATAFQLNDKITSVSLPSTITSIGRLSFADCTSLTTINIPEGVTTLGISAFSYCTALEEIDLPSTLVSIGMYGFDTCTAATKLTCRAVTPPEAGWDAFCDMNYSIPVYVPEASISSYQAADEWEYFTNFQALPAETPGTGGIQVEGEMSAQIDMSMGYGDEPDLLDPETYEVVAQYDEEASTITLDRFAESMMPIKFTLDIEEGSVAALGEQVAFEESYDGDTFTYYYGDVATESLGVYGTIRNLNETQCEMLINPWGEAMPYDGGYFFNNAYFNTVVTLDMNIAGLAYKPQIYIENVEHEVELTDVYLYVDYSELYLPENSTITAYVTDSFDPSLTVTQMLESSPALIIIPGAAPDKVNETPHNYTVTLVVSDADDSEIANAVYTTGQFGVVTGIDGIQEDEAPARYYNLQGVEVKEPANGIFIRVQGNRSGKYILR